MQMNSQDDQWQSNLQKLDSSSNEAVVYYNYSDLCSAFAVRHILYFVHLWFFGPKISYHLTMIFMNICKLNCWVLKRNAGFVYCKRHIFCFHDKGRQIFLYYVCMQHVCVCICACVCMHACVYVHACVWIEDTPVSIKTCEKMFPALSNFPPGIYNLKKRQTYT